MRRSTLDKLRRIEQMLEASGEMIYLTPEEKRLGVEIGYDNIENDELIVTLHYLIQMVKKYREASKKKMKITKLEKQIIEALEFSDFSNEHEAGLYGHIYHDEWNMNVFRGVMASLSKKGLVSWSEAEYINNHPDAGCNWGFINPEYTIIENDFAAMNWDIVEVSA